MFGKHNKYKVAPKSERTDPSTGRVFASKGEMLRWNDLRLIQMAGKISGLRKGARYKLVVNDVLIGNYTPDYEYEECGVTVYEDFKGTMTRDAILRIKLFEALYKTKVRLSRR